MRRSFSRLALGVGGVIALAFLTAQAFGEMTQSGTCPAPGLTFKSPSGFAQTQVAYGFPLPFVATRTDHCATPPGVTTVWHAEFLLLDILVLVILEIGIALVANWIARWRRQS